jgi:hypothetical protein
LFEEDRQEVRKWDELLDYFCGEVGKRLSDFL